MAIKPRWPNYWARLAPRFARACSNSGFYDHTATAFLATLHQTTEQGRGPDDTGAQAFLSAATHEVERCWEFSDPCTFAQLCGQECPRAGIRFPDFRFYFSSPI